MAAVAPQALILAEYTFIINSLTKETKLVCCADKLSNIRSMASDKTVVGDQLWERFNATKDRIKWYYEGVSSAMLELENYPMYQELNTLINEVFG